MGEIMKGIMCLIMVLILSIMSIPIVYAKSEVKIDSYQLTKKSEHTTELSKPKIDGLNISFDLSFLKEKDYAVYQIVVSNTTKTDYEINKETDFQTSKYIEYSYDFENNNNIVKANSKLTMYITITYAHEVPTSMLKDGKYSEDNKLSITLSNEKNPDTSINVPLISIAILTVIGITLVLYIKTKNKAYLNLLFITLLIPTTIYAIEKIKINVTTKITVVESYKLTYNTDTLVKSSEKDEKCVYNLITRNGRGEPIEPTTYVINDKEYERCTVQTTELHAAGERISPKGIPFIYLDKDAYDYDNNRRICNINEEGTKYICSEDIINSYIYETYQYHKVYNISYQDNDITVMNIKTIAHNYLNEDDGYVEFHLPNEFTMPKHDVVLTGYHSFEK